MSTGHELEKDLAGGGEPTEQERRDRAVKRLRKQADFRVHLLVYVLVNAFLVVIWYVTGGVGVMFWPIFPMVGWGIGLAMHAWDAFGRDPVTEERIRREMGRMR